MGRTAVFLGAGASKPLGIPLTGEIFPMLLERLWSRPSLLFLGDETDQERLQESLQAILPGLSAPPAEKKALDEWRKSLPLITDVLSAVDYMLLSGNAPRPSFSQASLADARVLLEQAMFEILVRDQSSGALLMDDLPDSLSSEWKQTEKHKILPSTPAKCAETETRKRMERWITNLASGSQDHVALISTNYDVEVEQELYNQLGYRRVYNSVDFGTSVRDPDRVTGSVHRRPTDARLAVHKLHGSFNWLRCDLCDHIYLNPVGAIAYLSFLEGERAVRLRKRKPCLKSWLDYLEESGAHECHCGFRPLRHVIVAPSFVRDVRDPILLEVWRSALEALRQADHWIIIGYSLPPEDVAIRSMLLRAYQGRDIASPRVTVIQWEKKEPELTRYNLLFPRGSYRYVPGGLAAYLDAQG